MRDSGAFQPQSQFFLLPSARLRRSQLFPAPIQCFCLRSPQEFRFSTLTHLFPTKHSFIQLFFSTALSPGSERLSPNSVCLVAVLAGKKNGAHQRRRPWQTSHHRKALAEKVGHEETVPFDPTPSKKIGDPGVLRQSGS